MTQNRLAEFVDELDFRKAFRRVKKDAYYDFIQLPVELEIFESAFDDNVNFLIDSIKQGRHTVKPLRKIWVPKKQFFLRPGSIPHLEDRVIFQAIVDEIAPTVEAQLPPIDQDVVFSSRLHPDPKSDSMFIHPRALWLSFKDKAVNLCHEEDVTDVLIADIASYFENIDLRLLGDNLSSYGVAPKYTDAILHILKKWANGGTRGLPQMMAPCSLLANIYLAQVDKRMHLRGYRYIRYVDDMRVFASSEVELRQALLALTEELKRCYLDVQASKTMFVTAKEHRKALTVLEKNLERFGIEVEFDPDGSYVAEAFWNNDESIPEDKLIRFLEELIVDPQYDDRHLRFCINRLGRIASPAARLTVLDNLESMPQEAATFVRYLLNIKAIDTQDTIDRVIEFLKSDFSIYDWQSMWLLVFLNSVELSESQLSELYRIRRLTAHWINRALLYYLLSSQGDLTVRRGVVAEYGQEHSKEVKMAILCGLHTLEKRERNRFYAIAGGDRQLDQLINLVKTKPVEFCGTT